MNIFGYIVLVKPYDASSIGRRVAQYRRANRMSADQLAAKVDGLTRTSVAKLENGYRVDLSTELLVEIAIALRVPPVALLLPITDPKSIAAIETDSINPAESTSWTVLDLLKLSQGWDRRDSPPAASETHAQLAALRAYIALEATHGDAIYDMAWPNQNGAPENDRKSRLDAAKAALDAQIVACRRLGIDIPDTGFDWSE